jgi:pimeloyl-ACP methyl ester carboxylesterase
MPNSQRFGQPQFSIRRWLLDQLCLRPTRQLLDAAPQELFWIDRCGRRLACYRQRQWPDDAREPLLARPDDRTVDLLIVKFPGNAGRAEQSPIHPANGWPEKCVEVWSINPPGYGQSHGRASLDHIPATAHAVWAEVQQRFPTTPLLIYGNSIGSLTAMQMVKTVRREQTSVRLGLMLRNPPDLIRLILDHRRRWYHGPVPWWLTRAAAPHLHLTALAVDCDCPLLLIQAELDTLVPPSNQDRIFAAHPGPKEKFIIPQADHHQGLSADDRERQQQYNAALRRIFQHL